MSYEVNFSHQCCHARQTVNLNNQSVAIQGKPQYYQSIVTEGKTQLPKCCPTRSISVNKVLSNKVKLSYQSVVEQGKTLLSF